MPAAWRPWLSGMPWQALLRSDVVDGDSDDIVMRDICAGALRLLRLLVTWISSSVRAAAANGISGDIDEMRLSSPASGSMNGINCVALPLAATNAAIAYAAAARALLPVIRACDGVGAAGQQLDTEMRAMRTTWISVSAASILTETPIGAQQLKQRGFAVISPYGLNLVLPITVCLYAVFVKFIAA